MRPLCLFAALCAAAVAAAQAPTESHERAIWDAYQNSRQADLFKLEMTGADEYGKVTSPVHAVLYLRRSIDPRTGFASRAQADLTVFRSTKEGEVVSMRLVGDGVNLFRYDLDRREVSTTTYGFYGDRAPDNYVNTTRSDMPKLLAQLRAATPGLTTYLVRLAAEMNPAGDGLVAKFTNWDPGAYGLSFNEVPPMWRTGVIVTDPITRHEFTEDGDRYVFFGYDREVPERTVAFDLYDADPDDTRELWEIRSVNVASLSPGRRVALSIAPKNPLEEPLAQETFQPYAGQFGASFRLINRGR